MNSIKRIFKQRKHKKELEEKYNEAWFNLEAQSGVVYSDKDTSSESEGNRADAAYTNQIAKR